MRQSIKHLSSKTVESMRPRDRFLQCPGEVAEAVLGYSRKGIEGTYDLHSYDNECSSESVTVIGTRVDILVDLVFERVVTGLPGSIV